MSDKDCGDRLRREGDTSKLARVGSNPEAAGLARLSMIFAAAALPVITIIAISLLSEVWANVKDQFTLLNSNMEKFNYQLNAQSTSIAVQSSILTSLDKRVEGLETRERSR